MESRAKFLGHPVHQMLVPIPAGLFIVAAVLDIVDAFAKTAWIPTVTYWNISLGIIGALVAAVFGITDLLKVPDGTRAKRVGTLHGIGNIIAVLLFAIAIWMRTRALDHQVSAVTLALEVIAFAMLGVTAWLGGELVDRLGVGVDDGANLNAPNSLRAKHVPHSRS
jgi:uncharacterized membrane protein